MSEQQTLMNISESTPYLNGNCDLKCDYSFYYQLSICSIYPNSDNTFLHFTYENNSNGTKQVLYNGVEYNVSGILISSPSIHYFDGNQAEAEIIITHHPVLGNGLPLFVSIPITTSQGSIPNQKGSKLLNEMISFAVSTINTTQKTENELNNEISGVDDQISSSSLKQNLSNITKQIDGILYQPQVLNITNYTLEFVIPRGPFFSYADTNESINYIVYGMNYAIFVEPNIIKNLQNTIKPFYSNPSYNTTGTGNIFPLFLNQTGATNLLTTNLSDEIYIDCQPTGSSNQQTNITTSTTTEPNKTNSVMFFIYVMFFIFVLFLIYMLFTYITHPDKKTFQ
jgi:hypothetical protein